MTTPAPFIYYKQSFTCHLRHSKPTAPGSLYVAVHTNSYGHSLDFLNSLLRHLTHEVNKTCMEAGIVVSFESAEVEKLAGPSYKNIFSVETRITFKASAEDVAKQLIKIGSFEGLEYVLG
jgi:hypothetical protein